MDNNMQIGQQPKQTVPYSVASMILGISSILFGCFIVGLACGIVGLVLANKGYAIYKTNPSLYSGEGMLQAGKITSIIGIVLGGISVIYYIAVLILVGSAGFGVGLLDALN